MITTVLYFILQVKPACPLQTLKIALSNLSYKMSADLEVQRGGGMVLSENFFVQSLLSIPLLPPSSLEIEFAKIFSNQSPSKNLSENRY